MGNGMDKILPGLYVGSIRDAKNEKLLRENRITHILSIHDNAKPLIKGMRYLCIVAHDKAEQDLIQYFPQCNDFIHDARLSGGAVLVHCLAGVSRSVTVTVAYLMTVTGLEWRDALNAVRGARRCANPNFGFQRQLVAFQHEHLHVERARLRRERVRDGGEELAERAELQRLCAIHQHWVLHGDADTHPAEENTYPLPHNAYGKKYIAAAAAASEEELPVHTDDHDSPNTKGNGDAIATHREETQEETCSNSQDNEIDMVVVTETVATGVDDQSSSSSKQDRAADMNVTGGGSDRALHVSDTGHGSMGSCDDTDLAAAEQLVHEMFLSEGRTRKGKAVTRETGVTQDTAETKTKVSVPD